MTYEEYMPQRIEAVRADAARWTERQEFHKEEIATHMDDMLVCSHNARSAHELLEQLLEEWLKHQEEHHGDK